MFLSIIFDKNSLYLSNIIDNDKMDKELIKGLIAEYQQFVKSVSFCETCGDSI